jgi:hypothetical protein
MATLKKNGVLGISMTQGYGRGFASPPLKEFGLKLLASNARNTRQEGRSASGGKKTGENAPFGEAFRKPGQDCDTDREYGK